MELCPCFQHHRSRSGHDDGAHSSARQPCCHSLDRIAAGNHVLMLELLTRSVWYSRLFCQGSAFVLRYFNCDPLFCKPAAGYCKATLVGT